MKFPFPCKALCSAVILCLSVALSAWAQPVTLVKNGKSNWQVIATSAKPEVLFAAGELQKYISRISGCQLPVVSANSQASPGIVVGLREDLPRKYTSLPARKDGYDGYVVQIANDGKLIIIAGDNGPGVIYGVYDVLERLGCRWFYPTSDQHDPEVVPASSTITIAPGSWAMASPIKYRICNGDGWTFNIDAPVAIKNLDWAMKNRYNMMAWQGEIDKMLEVQYKKFEDEGILAEIQKRGMSLHGPLHAFNVLLPHDKYMKDHPEWFGMRDGKRVPQVYAGAQFCWSNAEARKQLIANAEAFIKTAPLIKIFCPLPFDGGPACECGECKKAGASNLLMVVASEMAAKLEKSCPDIMVETIGGYGAVPNPPTNLDIIHPRLRIDWAHWGRRMTIGYDDPGYDKTGLDGWRKAAKGGLTITQYYPDNFAEPWILGPFAKAMISDRRYFLKHQVDAIYTLIFPGGYWWNHGLNGYLSGQCFYDVSLDPFKVVNDYAQNYYGKDAGPLLDAYYTQWAKEIELSYHITSKSTKADRDMLARQRREWIDPAVAATKNSPVYAYRVAKVEKLHRLAEMLTEAHRQYDIIQHQRYEGKFDEAAKTLEQAKVYTDKCIEMFKTLDKLNQGLTDSRHAAGFPYIELAIKWWLLDEAKRIDQKDRTIPAAARKLSETEMLPGDALK